MANETFLRFPHQIDVHDDAILINGQSIKISHISNPDSLPWRDMGIDLVYECTGKINILLA